MLSMSGHNGEAAVWREQDEQWSEALKELWV